MNKVEVCREMLKLLKENGLVPLFGHINIEFHFRGNKVFKCLFDRGDSVDVTKLEEQEVKSE